VRFGKVEELLQLGEFGADFLGVQEAGPARNNVAALIQQQCCWLARNTKVVPALARLVPIHFGSGHLVSTHEGLGLLEVVLGANADNGELGFISSSEPLETGGFPVASASMGRPEPSQRGELAGVQGGKIDALTGLDVRHCNRRVALDLFLG
jgi:hypothetical protein